MKTVMIHGQRHKGSTYQIAHMPAEKIGGNVQTSLKTKMLFTVMRLDAKKP